MKNNAEGKTTQQGGPKESHYQDNH